LGVFLPFIIAHIVLENLKGFLDAKVKIFNNKSFIKNDPISVPHQFTILQDIEIAGLFAALFAWGNRTTIINKSTELMQLMHNAPYEFIKQFTETDLKAFVHFKHRTFTNIDIMYLLEWLQHYYKTNNSLENIFVHNLNPKSKNIKSGLIHFNNQVFTLPHAPKRTQKHISTPLKNSACKRINMYLRWMVRNDSNGVDFGLWKTIKPAQLIIPLDVHVSRVAYKFKLIPTSNTNWTNAEMLTENLKLFNAKDPVKYDFALFSLGAEEKYA
jgi:uncharacterized protein (TIGR02757 family)